MQALRDAFEQARHDANAIEAAIAVAEGYLERHPDCALAEAYAGSLQAMRAGASTLPWVKLRHANAAAALLDRAHERRFGTKPSDCSEQVHLAAELAIALLRGIAFASFPSFLGREEAARVSLDEAIRHPQFDSVPAPDRARALAHLAVHYHRRAESEEARRYREAALESDEPVAIAIWGTK